MILYNTTFAIDKAAENALTDFIKNVYIPVALKAGMREPILSKVRPMEDDGEDTAVSLALQLLAPSQPLFNEFAEIVVPRIFAEMPAQLASALQVFCTELDVLFAACDNGKIC